MVSQANNYIRQFQQEFKMLKHDRKYIESYRTIQNQRSQHKLENTDPDFKVKQAIGKFFKLINKIDAFCQLKIPQAPNCQITDDSIRNESSHRNNQIEVLDVGKNALIALFQAGTVGVSDFDEISYEEFKNSGDFANTLDCCRQITDLLILLADRVDSHTSQIPSCVSREIANLRRQQNKFYDSFESKAKAKTSFTIIEEDTELDQTSASEFEEILYPLCQRISYEISRDYNHPVDINIDFSHGKDSDISRLFLHCNGENAAAEDLSDYTNNIKLSIGLSPGGDKFFEARISVLTNEDLELWEKVDSKFLQKHEIDSNDTIDDDLISSVETNLITSSHLTESLQKASMAIYNNLREGFFAETVSINNLPSKLGYFYGQDDVS